MIAGATRTVLGFKVTAPSAIGTILCGFTFNHVRQPDAVLNRTPARAWRAGAGPSYESLVVDLESTTCEVHGTHEQTVGYDSVDTTHGEVRFVDQLVAIPERANASGRCSSGPIQVRGPGNSWTTLITTASPGRSP